MKSKPLYSYLSKYRSELMGIAILWVVWFHSVLYLDFFPHQPVNKVFDYLKEIGYSGVDIFLLVSGMGIYKSLKKNDTASYFKNRVKKIVPIWWTYLLLNVVLGTLVFDIVFTKTEILSYASFTGFWFDVPNQGNWYVYFIMLVYLISPVLFSFLETSRQKKLTCVLMMLLTGVISLCFIGNFKLIAFSRMPIYIFGMYIASNEEAFKVTKLKMLLAFLILVAGNIFLFMMYKSHRSVMWKYGLWWYPFLLLAPSLALLLSVFFEKCWKVMRYPAAFFRLMGKASLEILLISEYFFANFKKLGFDLTPRWRSILEVVLSLIFGVAFHFLIEGGKKLAGRIAAGRKGERRRE